MLANFFSFSGRLNRKKFWLMTLAIYAVFIVFGLLLGATVNISSFTSIESTGDGTTIDRSSAGVGSAIGGAIIIALILAAFISSLSIQVRRLHDRNLSGWWLLGYFVISTILSGAGGISGMAIIFGFINLIIAVWIFVVLGFLKGTTGPNQYGPDPLAENADPALFGR